MNGARFKRRERSKKEKEDYRKFPASVATEHVARDGTSALNSGWQIAKRVIDAYPNGEIGEYD